MLLLYSKQVFRNFGTFKTIFEIFKNGCLLFECVIYEGEYFYSRFLVESVPEDWRNLATPSK